MFENTKITAYYLWEYTKFDNALNLWHCAEDIAYYFEINDLLTFQQVLQITQSSKHETQYIDFIRNIAFRIHICTGCNNALHNWYIAERVIFNHECLVALLEVTNIYRRIRNGDDTITQNIRSEWIRKLLT